MHLRLRRLGTYAAAVLAGSCASHEKDKGCSSSGGLAARLIPGGGAGDGSPHGTLHVFVVDGRFGQPIGGATVRLGRMDAPGSTKTTDSSGLATFRDDALVGKQTVGASTDAYRAATWVGVDAANVTIPLEPEDRLGIPLAVVEGTIAGWDTLAVASGHALTATVEFTRIGGIGDPRNDISPGERTIPGGPTVGASTCLRTPQLSDCNFRLSTRGGVQAHVASIVDVDLRGTESTEDDTRTPVGFAVLRGLDITAGRGAVGESIPQLAATASIDVAYDLVPAGLAPELAVPILDLGTEGSLPLSASTADAGTSSLVPALEGPLAGARYSILAKAAGESRSSLVFVDGQQPGTVHAAGWIAPPAGRVEAGRITFDTVTGADLHRVTLIADGTEIADVLVFDDTRELRFDTAQVPAQGTLELRFQASRIPGVDLRSFDVPALRAAIRGLSDQNVDYPR